jgi:hypothetical protein
VSVCLVTEPSTWGTEDKEQHYQSGVSALPPGDYSDLVPENTGS